MGSIQVSSEYGIIVRRPALAERGVSWADLLSALEVSVPLDSNESLASFGPHFGREAVDEFLRRLTRLGLVYFDDFFEFSGEWPLWCKFKAYSPD